VGKRNGDNKEKMNRRTSHFLGQCKKMRLAAVPNAIPLDVPRRLGDLISGVVELFASKHRLEHEIWYHDQPIWLVWEQEGDTFRKVQITAFEGQQDDALFFVPAAYRFRNDDLFSTQQEATTHLIGSLPLRSLSTANPNAVTLTRGQIRQCLEKAWKCAQQFTEDQITLVPR